MVIAAGSQATENIVVAVPLAKMFDCNPYEELAPAEKGVVEVKQEVKRPSEPRIGWIPKK